MSVARLYRVGSPYNGVELAEIDYEQSADVLYMAHIDHPVTKLIRHDHASWEFADAAFAPTIAGPIGVAVTPTTPNTGTESAPEFLQDDSYVVTAIDDDSGQESRVSSSVTASNDLTLKGNYNTVGWTAAAGAERYRIYKSHVTSNYGFIGETAALTFRDDNIAADTTDGPPEAYNPFAAAGDYPSTVTFFEQRLLLGRTRNKLNGVWGSRSAEFDNFDLSRPLKDSDSLAFGLVADRVNAVNHLVSTTELLALTSDSVFRVSGAGSQGYLSPSQIVVRRQIGRASSRLRPLVVDNVVFYRPSSGNSIRAINYSFEQDGFQSNDVSIFSPHLFEGFEITWWAYAQEPRSLIWAGRSDGTLLCFTWEQEQQVWGWTVCDLGGPAIAGTVISETGADERLEDRLYVVVERIVGGVARRLIERMAAAEWRDVAASCFVDCAVSYAFDVPTAALTNLDHLEGETLTGLADGNVVEGLVVTGGRVTLPDPARMVTVGLGYEALIETLPLAFAGPAGAITGRRQQIGQAVVRLYDSRGVSAGPSGAALYEIKPRADEPIGAPNALLNGAYPLDAAPHVSGETCFIVSSRYPLPMTITGVALDAIVGS